MKPDYYEDFTCIADRCSFTCCREWKIGVDEDTFVKWKHTLTPDGMYDTDRGQQAKKEKLSGYVRKKDGSRVIGLNMGMRYFHRPVSFFQERSIPLTKMSQNTP